MATTSFAVVGLGQFGRHLAVTLSRAGIKVVAVDNNAAHIESIKDLVARAVRADASDEQALRAAGVDEVGCAVLALGEEDFEASTLAVAALAALKVPRIIARSSSVVRGKVLQLVGAHAVVFPELQAAEQLAMSLLSPGLQAALALPSGYTIAQVVVPMTFVGQTLHETITRERLRLSIVALRRKVERNGQSVERAVEPEPEMVFEEGDVLVVAGKAEHVDKLGREVL